jgi:hypothetical protein
MGYWAIVGVVPAVPLALHDAVAKGALLVGIMALVMFQFWFGFLETHEVYGGGDDAIPVEELTNCPACGARVSVEAGTCEYCDEPTEQE